MLENIKINPEFERLIPPLIDDEFDVLEANILSEGEIYTPIFVWNGYIIDGHHRHKILIKHDNIKFRIIEKEFENKYEAMSWMCNNQLGRRNLTPENRKYLVGKKYDAEKRSYGSSDGFRGNQHKKVVDGYFSHLPKEQKANTRQRVAEETGTTQAYVRFADEFAKGVDAAEEAVPGIKKEILSGKIKKPAKEIAEIAKAPIEERRALTENLRLIKNKEEKDKSHKTIKSDLKVISAEMRDVDAPVSDESVIESLDGTVDMFIETCETYFVDHPNILIEEQLYKKVLIIMEKARQYTNKFKGD